MMGNRGEHGLVVTQLDTVKRFLKRGHRYPFSTTGTSTRIVGRHTRGVGRQQETRSITCQSLSSGTVSSVDEEREKLIGEKR